MLSFDINNLFAVKAGLAAQVGQSSVLLYYLPWEDHLLVNYQWENLSAMMNTKN